MPTRQPESPLILLTNDDGVASPGLRAAVQAVLPFGEVLVVAPAQQWSGAGRSMPRTTEPRISRYPLEIEGQVVQAYQVDTSPALTVVCAVLTLAPRQPTILISGINYGENVGSDITVSGTVGAALQGAAFGIPSLAISLQTPKETHYNPSDGVDFAAAMHFTKMFARWLLQLDLPFDVDVLKLDVPSDATTNTPWRVTRVSRHTYFVAASEGQVSSMAPDPALSIRETWTNPDYKPLDHPERTEPDSDIYALAVDRVVSVAPLSLDLTSRADPAELEALWRNHDTTLTR